MVWIKIKNTLINLDNVSFVEKRNNKLIISPVIEIITKSNEHAEQIYEIITKAVELKNNFVDIDKLINVDEAIEF